MDYALVACRLHNFRPGLLFLYEASLECAQRCYKQLESAVAAASWLLRVMNSHVEMAGTPCTRRLPRHLSRRT